MVYLSSAITIYSLTPRMIRILICAVLVHLLLKPRPISSETSGNALSEQLPGGLKLRIDGVFYSFTTDLCSGGIVMKKNIQPELICVRGYFLRRKKVCSMDGSDVIGGQDYVCRKNSHVVEAFLSLTSPLNPLEHTVVLYENDKTLSNFRRYSYQLALQNGYAVNETGAWGVIVVNSHNTSPVNIGKLCYRGHPGEAGAAHLWKIDRIFKKNKSTFGFFTKRCKHGSINLSWRQGKHFPLWEGYSDPRRFRGEILAKAGLEYGFNWDWEESAQALSSPKLIRNCCSDTTLPEESWKAGNCCSRENLIPNKGMHEWNSIQSSKKQVNPKHGSITESILPIPTLSRPLSSRTKVVETAPEYRNSMLEMDFSEPSLQVFSDLKQEPFPSLMEAESNTELDRDGYNPLAGLEKSLTATKFSESPGFPDAEDGNTRAGSLPVESVSEKLLSSVEIIGGASKSEDGSANKSVNDMESLSLNEFTITNTSPTTLKNINKMSSSSSAPIVTPDYCLDESGENCAENKNKSATPKSISGLQEKLLKHNKSSEEESRSGGIPHKPTINLQLGSPLKLKEGGPLPLQLTELDPHLEEAALFAKRRILKKMGVSTESFDMSPRKITKNENSGLEMEERANTMWFKIVEGSADVVKKLFPPMLVPTEFVIQTVSLFGYMFRNIPDDNDALDVETFESIVDALKHCEISASMYKTEQFGRPPVVSRVEITGIDGSTEMTDFKGLPPSSSSFHSPKTDVIVESVWNVIDVVLCACYDNFLPNKMNDHHRLYTYMRNIFRNEEIQKLWYSAWTGKKIYEEILPFGNHKRIMYNYDKLKAAVHSNCSYSQWIPKPELPGSIHSGAVKSNWKLSNWETGITKEVFGEEERNQGAYESSLKEKSRRENMASKLRANWSSVPDGISLGMREMSIDAKDDDKPFPTRITNSDEQDDRARKRYARFVSSVSAGELREDMGNVLQKSETSTKKPALLEPTTESTQRTRLQLSVMSPLDSDTNAMTPNKVRSAIFENPLKRVGAFDVWKNNRYESTVLGFRGVHPYFEKSKGLKHGQGAHADGFKLKTMMDETLIGLKKPGLEEYEIWGGLAFCVKTINYVDDAGKLRMMGFKPPFEEFCS